MVHIIGLENHFFQIVGANTKKPAEKLRSFIEAFLEKNTTISLIAEELTPDYCGIGCEEIVCKSIADNSNGEIGHQFVEMNDADRAANKVKSEDHSAREKHWMSEISEALKANKQILFVCGRAHASNFEKLLNKNGHEAIIETLLYSSYCNAKIISLNL